MNIIRDKEGFGLFMIPLLVDWGIRRCNVQGCKAKPSTIVTQIEDVPVFGLCENHFQEGNKLGEFNLQLEWDDFDAFAAKATGENDE